MFVKQSQAETINTNGFAPNRIITWALIILAALLSILVLAKVYFYIYYGLSTNHVAGAWTSIAYDLSQGIFYRPLYGEETGYGGTRFFPLFFSLHALLIKTGGSPLWSGHALSLFAGVLLLFAFYELLRKSGLEKSISFIFTMLLMSSMSIQHGFETIRGDILPLALSLVGLLIFLSNPPQRMREILASLCFVFAFSAKITSVSAFVALFLWLYLNNRKSEAIRIAIYTVAGYFVFLGLLYALTSGRVFTIFKASATGGVNWYEFPILAPLTFISQTFDSDRPATLFFVWAIVLFFMFIRQVLNNLAAYYFVISLGVTLVIFGSPATGANHLVDIVVASLWFVASSLKNRDAQFKEGMIYLSGFLLIVAMLMNVAQLRDGINMTLADKGDKVSRYPKELIQMVKEAKGPVFSEDPMLNVIAGQSPPVLDSFMLRLVSEKDKQLATKFKQQIEAKAYPHIVLIRQPLQTRSWYYNTHIGRKNFDLILANYELVKNFGISEKHGQFFVLVPKQ